MVGNCSVDVKGAGWLLQLRRQDTATHLSRLDAVEEVAQRPPRGVLYSVVHLAWRAWRDRFALALLLRRFANRHRDGRGGTGPAVALAASVALAPWRLPSCGWLRRLVSTYAHSWLASRNACLTNAEADKESIELCGLRPHSYLSSLPLSWGVSQRHRSRRTEHCHDGLR